jgi:hypothetical protein
MRSFSRVIFFTIVLWLGDLFFFKGRYANELRVTVETMGHNIKYQITRRMP